MILKPLRRPCLTSTASSWLRGLPVGFIWGEQDGEVLFHPDEAVTAAIRTVFERFAEFGSARCVWLWFRSEGLSLPLQQSPAGQPGPIRWVAPTYTATTRATRASRSQTGPKAALSTSRSKTGRLDQ